MNPPSPFGFLAGPSAWVRVFGALLLLTACTACSRNEEENKGTRDASPSASADFPRNLGSLPPFDLTDESGHVFNRETLEGKIWIANFIFTRCGSTCPRQTAVLAKLQRELETSPQWEDVRLISFTVDPEFDRPEVLKTYGTGHGANFTRWKFVTGSREALWDLSKKGFKLDVGDDARTEVMPIYHSPRLVLIDRSTRIRGYHDGLDPAGLADLKEDMGKVLKEAEARGP